MDYGLWKNMSNRVHIQTKDIQNNKLQILQQTINPNQTINLSDFFIIISPGSYIQVDIYLISLFILLVYIVSVRQHFPFLVILAFLILTSILQLLNCQRKQICSCVIFIIKKLLISTPSLFSFAKKQLFHKRKKFFILIM